MTDRPTTKLVRCPECDAEFPRLIVWFGDREIMADRGCLCDACEARRASAVEAATAQALHLAKWRNRVPEDYHRRATEERVPERLRAVLAWRPSADARRLGIFGPPGGGKTMAVTLLAKLAELPFEWTNGFALKLLNAKAAAGNDHERLEAGRRYAQIREAPLLVIDDVDKGNFTEAWAGALFDLLEYRNGKLLATVWTANHAPAGIATKIARCGDPDIADAIERRLAGGATLIEA